MLVASSAVHVSHGSRAPTRSARQRSSQLFSHTFKSRTDFVRPFFFPLLQFFSIQITPRRPRHIKMRFSVYSSERNIRKIGEPDNKNMRELASPDIQKAKDRKYNSKTD